MSKVRIAIFAGGWSGEREVSLKSGFPITTPPQLCPAACPMNTIQAIHRLTRCHSERSAAKILWERFHAT